MGDARIAVAFTAGMLATVNPCALPMLPAYLGWFITGDDERQPAGAAVARAVAVALSVALGFVAVFGTLGLLATAASAQVEEVTPWITPVVGVALAVVGVVLVSGRTLKVPLPRLDRSGGGGRGMAAMVAYGASYAVVSVSCALPVFLIQVSTTFGEGWDTGLTQLAGFAVGFALVLVALSVSVALARGSLAAVARSASAHVSRVSGALLVLAGVYLVWYGLAEIRLDTRTPDDPVIDRVTGWSSDISARVQDIGGVELGLVLALFVAAVALVVVLRAGGRSRTS
ncbi:cytochrome c biogenesis protein CcdA [Iamia sp. SCSIO 61187]|uniref:cytochrome c biogenesis CcdA family protein n=1 Tax=Iamia sp. SCSIO 61187 TaxID=2722752 RepID=UPI001C63673E|nr:cytochrome c biogenesis protein CcdA [Iamia sp. SCSIO 61187]QYG91118.1 cytochrome c biogenesis protein CcdA [Iamia sp. SCSIO 61187]